MGIDDALARLQHELQELSLVVFGVVRQQHVGEQVAVALVQLVEVIEGRIPVARRHGPEYRLLGSGDPTTGTGGRRSRE